VQDGQKGKYMTRTVERKPVTQAMQLALWRHWGIVYCQVCKIECCLFAPPSEQKGFHWDHHLAKVDGGPDTVENIRPVCVYCHRKKSAVEHKNNAKAKRIARKATEPKAPSLLKSRGFDTKYSKRMDGRVVRKTKPVQPV
jgi:hypothetical protein